MKYGTLVFFFVQQNFAVAFNILSWSKTILLWHLFVHSKVAYEDTFVNLTHGSRVKYQHQSTLTYVGVVVFVLLCPVSSVKAVRGVLGKHQTDMGPLGSQGGVLTGWDHHLNHRPETVNVTNSFMIYLSNFDVMVLVLQNKDQNLLV